MRATLAVPKDGMFTWNVLFEEGHYYKISYLIDDPLYVKILSKIEEDGAKTRYEVATIDKEEFSSAMVFGVREVPKLEGMIRTGE